MRWRVFQVARFKHSPVDVHALVDLQVVLEEYREKTTRERKIPVFHEALEKAVLKAGTKDQKHQRISFPHLPALQGLYPNAAREGKASHQLSPLP